MFCYHLCLLQGAWTGLEYEFAQLCLSENLITTALKGKIGSFGNATVWSYLFLSHFDVTRLVFLLGVKISRYFSKHHTCVLSLFDWQALFGRPTKRDSHCYDKVKTREDWGEKILHVFFLPFGESHNLLKVFFFSSSCKILITTWCRLCLKYVRFKLWLSGY